MIKKNLNLSIKKFEKDELEHHDIGIAHDAKKTPGYSFLSKVISLRVQNSYHCFKKNLVL